MCAALSPAACGATVDGAMAFKLSILVVANRTADSDELSEALRARAEQRPASYTIVVPPTGGGPEARAAAKVKLAAALQRLRDAGLEIDGRIGPPDPVDAVHAVWDPRHFDEVIVSTLPGQASKWLLMDLPHRIARLTGVQVTHVVASDEKVKLEAVPLPARDRPGVLAPLSVLSWGGRPPAPPRGEEKAPDSPSEPPDDAA
jgi:hypothetical protein